MGLRIMEGFVLSDEGALEGRTIYNPEDGNTYAPVFSPPPGTTAAWNWRPACCSSASRGPGSGSSDVGFPTGRTEISSLARSTSRLHWKSLASHILWERL